MSVEEITKTEKDKDNHGVMNDVVFKVPPES